jgi:hypothetical protein
MVHNPSIVLPSRQIWASRSIDMLKQHQSGGHAVLFRDVACEAYPATLLPANGSAACTEQRANILESHRTSIALKPLDAHTLSIMCDVATVLAASPFIDLASLK